MPRITPTTTPAAVLRHGHPARQDRLGDAVARQGRPMLGLSLLVLLAACGQTTQPQSSQGVATRGGYNRPASYNPPGPSSDPWGPWIREAARRFDVPERWVREVMRQESGGRVSATSPVGAMGLMQVMPGTYAELRGRYGLGEDPYHPYDSIMAGTAYLREMYELYGSPAFLAAYNAGPRRLEDYLWNNRGLPTETRNYVARIGPNVVAHHPARRVAPEIYAAAELPLYIPAGPRRMDTSTMLALKEQRDAQQPGIQVAQLPPGPVVRMEPIPDGSTGFAAMAPSARPVQLASLGGLTGEVVRMDPIPDGSTPEGAAGIAASQAAAEAAAMPPVLAAPAYRPPPAAAGRAMPVYDTRAPAAPARLAWRGQPMLAANAAPPRPATGSREFGLLGTAQASTLPAGLRARPAAGAGPAGAAPGGWAVQVGAFGSKTLARSAANTARNSAGAAGTRAMVQPVAQGRSTLYRARVTGLSQPAAQAVCDRLRSRGGCLVLSPDAQG